jgi:hypothetical protein
VIEGKRPRVDECLLDGAAHPVSVVRVDRVEERFVGHRGAVRDPVQTVELGRPCNSVGVDVPRPAADVRDLLRLAKSVLRVGTLGNRGTEDEHADRDSGD